MSAPTAQPDPDANAGERLRAAWRATAERWAAVNAHLPLEAPGRLGRAIQLSQQTTRYLLRWYINPLVEQQNHFNAALLSLEALHHAREQELLRELTELRQRVATLEAHLAPITSTDQ